jgi:hypothetical protein
VAAPTSIYANRSEERASIHEQLFRREKLRHRRTLMLLPANESGPLMDHERTRSRKEIVQIENHARPAQATDMKTLPDDQMKRTGKTSFQK